MEKYLWDLDIEKIPLGWENTYQHALKHFPDGKIATSPYVDEVKEVCYYHPVGYYAKLTELFNLNKSKAIEIYESDLDFKDKTRKLLHVDVALYALLSEWLESDDDFESSMFDPRRIEKLLVNFEYYFQIYKDNYISPRAIERFDHLKFISLFD